MSERIADLQGRLQKTRVQLEALATSVAALRARLNAEAGLASSLGRMAREPAPARHSVAPAEGDDGEDGRFLADSWEIALINEEEGK